MSTFARAEKRMARATRMAARASITQTPALEFARRVLIRTALAATCATTQLIAAKLTAAMEKRNLAQARDFALLDSTMAASVSCKAPRLLLIVPSRWTEMMRLVVSWRGREARR